MGVPGSESSVLGGAAGQSGAASGFYDYQIENSCRFDAADDSGLQWGGAGSYTLGTPTNSDKYTWSGWIKRGQIGNDYQNIIHAHTGGHGINTAFDENGTDDTLGVNTNVSVSGGDSTALFRDTTGWYHFVFAWDTTQSSNADRLKVYVNGNEISGFDDTISQNTNVSYNDSGNKHFIGRNLADGYGFDGLMAEINSIDGQQLTPTSFGEFKNSIWKPIDTSSLTFGNNGYRLTFSNSGSLGTDSSGNGNNFGLFNIAADHQEQDTPTFGS